MSQQPFIAAHAMHPDASMALALAAAQIEAQRAARGAAFDATLGIVYLSDRYANQAETLLTELQRRWPGVSWVGSVGVGVAASGVEYFDEPALTLMLTDLPRDSFALFNGRQPLAPATAAHGARAAKASHGAWAAKASRSAWAALVHADPATSELPELIAEASGRTESGYLFGGLASSRGRGLHIADGVFEGGLSGVAFHDPQLLVSRVTQGCLPIGASRRITAADRNLVLTLDGQPALPLLLADLGLTLEPLAPALERLRGTLAGLTDAADTVLARGGHFGTDTRVRHLIGIDPARQGVALGDLVATGSQLAFCQRNAAAARRDLVRICAEIRDEVETDAPIPALPTGPAALPAASRIRGAIYVSCSGRGGPHFGGPSAELKIVQHALGDVPLVGFFAGGEIARRHLYGYTGVLTVFCGGTA